MITMVTIVLLLLLRMMMMMMMINRVPCSKVASALLGSCTVQSELGDYEEAEHGAGIDYIRDIQFAPDRTDELMMKIAEMHQTQLQYVDCIVSWKYL